MKKILLLGALMAALAPSVAQAAPHAGGCVLTGTAVFDGAGLGVNTPSGPGAYGPAFTYGFSGTLANCQNTPATATVAAGQDITVGGVKVRLPRATGNGGCTASHTDGKSVVQWADGTLSIISYSTDGAAAAVALQGSVIGSLTVPVIDPVTNQQAVDPVTGALVTKTLTSTRFSGDYAGGALAFQPASPTDCQTGVKTAGISGIIGTGNYA